MAISTVIRKPRIYLTIVRHDRSGGIGSVIPIMPADIAGAIIDINTSRRLGDAGTFQITLNLTPPPAKFVTSKSALMSSTWADAILPMDIVQIIAEIDTPRGPVRETVMRGFIDYIGAAMNFGGPAPQRTIVIVGRDYYKILLAKLYFANGGIPPGVRVMQEMLAGFKDLQSHINDPQPERSAKDAANEQGKSSNDIMTVFFDRFYTAIFADLLGHYTIPTTGFGPLLPKSFFDAVSLDNFDGDLIAFSPAIDGDTQEPFVGIDELVLKYAHKPWRELFVDDYLDGSTTTSYLIWRPAPWLDYSGSIVQFSSPNVLPTLTYNHGIPWIIDPEELIEANLGLSDDQVINFIGTYSGIYAPLTESVKSLGSALESLTTITNPAVLGLQNPTETSSLHLYTWRPYEFHTPYFDKNDAASMQQKSAGSEKIATVAERWNNRLVRAFNHMELLDNGTLGIRGNPQIHIGNFVVLKAFGQQPTTKGKGEVLFYVEGVDHIFRYPTDQSSPRGSYITVLHVTRGRSRLPNSNPLGLF